jgi:hypothetical protein
VRFASVYRSFRDLEEFRTELDKIDRERLTWKKSNKLLMQNGEKITCPLCQDTVDKLVYRFHFENEKIGYKNFNTRL